MKLLLILAFLSCVSIGHANSLPDSELESSLTKNLNKRSAQDYNALSSDEIDQQRSNIETELRQLNHRRKRRYDHDRQCCRRCDAVEDCSCCQRLATQPCPYHVPERCGVPEPIVRSEPIVRNKTNVRTYTQKYNVSKIITVTDSPIDYQNIERTLIENLENEIRELKQTEEQRQVDYENRLRVEFNQLLPGGGSVDDSILKRLEEEIHNLRQNWPKSNPEERRVILENHISQQRREHVLNLNAWEDRRRQEFQTLLNDLKRKHDIKAPREIVVNFEVVDKETIREHEIYETIRQECCNRCAPQNCAPARQPCQYNCPVQQPCQYNCPAVKPVCPVVDQCRCNHAFVSCEY